jgi:putative transposase
VLVKPATVVQWHRKGFRLYWRGRSRRLGRPKMSTEIGDLIRRMSLANPLWGAAEGLFTSRSPKIRHKSGYRAK